MKRSLHLGVRELMNATATLDREVAPHIRGVPEVELFYSAAGGLEAVIRIF